MKKGYLKQIEWYEADYETTEDEIIEKWNMGELSDPYDIETIAITDPLEASYNDIQQSIIRHQYNLEQLKKQIQNEYSEISQVWIINVITSTIGLKLEQNIITLTVTNNNIHQQIKQVINEHREKERNAHY